MYRLLVMWSLSDSFKEKSPFPVLERSRSALLISAHDLKKMHYSYIFESQQMVISKSPPALMRHLMAPHPPPSLFLLYYHLTRFSTCITNFAKLPSHRSSTPHQESCCFILVEKVVYFPSTSFLSISP